MGTRRENGAGNVYRRPYGLYEARLRYLDPATGKRKRISVYAPTPKAARAKLKAARDRLEAGAPPRDATRTVGDWLKHWRATTLAASDRKASTKELYATLCRCYLETAPFGVISLDRLRPTDVEALILAMRERGLSASTIRSTNTVARAGLDGAVRDGLLGRNPVALVRRPGVTRREARHLAADTVTAVLAAAARSRYHSILLLIAATGLRRGEARGLRWCDVDLDAGVLRVVATHSRVSGAIEISEPKSVRSRRVVPLHPSIVALLRRHHTEQLRERLRAANQWQDHGLVFCTELGRPVEPRNMLRVIETAARTAGVDGIGVHTLRHSAAVAWLESGVHIKAVADLLGHSSVSVTGDTYGHTSDDAARAAIANLGARLGL
ncbi:MAG TPA: site-specific integrase [Mycobacterium sp.]|nr:site-specific integrase [Mycobacterium sp.]